MCALWFDVIVLNACEIASIWWIFTLFYSDFAFAFWLIMFCCLVLKCFGIGSIMFFRGFYLVLFCGALGAIVLTIL